MAATNFWDVHGFWLIFFLFFFPRLTLLFPSVVTGGVLWWLGWIFAPRLRAMGGRVRFPCAAPPGRPRYGTLRRRLWADIDLLFGGVLARRYGEVFSTTELPTGTTR